MAPSTVIEESTDEKHEQAKHSSELIGTINFGAVHTKLEVRYALLLARHMTNWTKHFELAIKLLEYCWTTREIGLIWSRGLDPHGVNVLSAYPIRIGPRRGARAVTSCR